eukprot:1792528-Rhodomonas_salina.2
MDTERKLGGIWVSSCANPGILSYRVCIIMTCSDTTDTILWHELQVDSVKTVITHRNLARNPLGIPSLRL